MHTIAKSNQAIVSPSVSFSLLYIIAMKATIIKISHNMIYPPPGKTLSKIHMNTCREKPRLMNPIIPDTTAMATKPACSFFCSNFLFAVRVERKQLPKPNKVRQEIIQR